MSKTTEMVSDPIEPNVLSFLEATLGTDQYQLLPLAGDASSRRYYRVVHNESSWVLMEWDPFVADDKYPFLSVQKHFALHGIHVPLVKGISGEKGLVLLEDLGDLTLERKYWESQNQEQAIPFYRQAIDELLKIHYVATANKTTKCTAFGIAFDTAKFLWEMNYGREHLIENLGQIQLSKTESDQLNRIFNDICSHLDQKPKFISHRDYHSRNLMLKLGKMRVIDFQDARMGPIQYDLVSLVHDSYVDLNEDSRNEILAYYIERAQYDYGQTILQDEFDECFRLQVIQRCFKACGSFSSFYNMRQDTRYLKYIRHTIETVLCHLEFFPQYAGFASILRDRGLLTMDFENL